MTNKIQTQHLRDVIKNHGRDMTNKVVAITGTTSGIGFVCARELAKKGATVILLNRKSHRSQSALQQLKEALPQAKFDAIDCDLQRLESVHEAINTIKNEYNVLDVLINNAGVMALKDQATSDGYDIQMQTNVISHFLITKELFSLLKKSKESRIVNHSSMARLGGSLEMKYFEKNGGNLGGDEAEEETPGFRGPRWERYHQTKLANAVFTYGLQTKLNEAGISNVIPLLAHPGLARTNLQATTAADGGMDADSEFMNQAQSAEDGATGIIRAALDPEAKPGNFYGPTAGWTGYPELIKPEDLLTDISNINVCWDGCEKATGKFEF
ncbi:MAG: NAD(P)-dependent dehydrogenase (short-subunit alcohol dehydrogenase family) [Lentimonas sp.]|jgi:NAD(P)-dependent dehydrogenase (short-subunit alcohol dehydrogenase family)